MDEKSKIPVNYIYFGIFFLFLILLSGGSVFVRENLSGSRFFFFLYAIIQSFLEITLYIFGGLMVRRFFGATFFSLYIGGTFLLFFSHFSDLIFDRILNLTCYETLMIFVLEETPEQLFYLLDASGIPIWIWMLLFAGVGLVPLIGIALYHATEFFTKKRPFFIKKEWILQSLICLPVALVLWDFSASKIIHPDIYTDFIKSVPWKFTFLQPETVQIPLKHPLPPPPKEAEIASFIKKNRTELKEKPNIYLFIIESLREDFITPEIAPHLSQFREKNHSFELALSNANGTNMAWFSIFHSQFPFYWNQLQKEGWEMGSPSLALLKKWGYQIRVISSAQLAYFGLDDLLFGKDRHLLDSYEAFHHDSSITAAMSDQSVIECLEDHLKKDPKQAQLYIIFLDSTHFDYSWGEETPFSPIATELAYIQAFGGIGDLEPLKNRYRNAIHYVDSLAGPIFNRAADESIVIVLGDHGEEFFEHGHLFHGSHLNREQTHIPLYFKFGSNSRPIVPRRQISQIDIFPSLLDYLSGSEVSFLRGKSIFRETDWPYALIARFTASRTPYEYCLHNGDHKMIFQFDHRRDIFRSKELEIRSISTADDYPFLECSENIREWVDSNFHPALKRIFEPKNHPH